MTTATRTPMPLPTASDKAFFHKLQVHGSQHTRITVEREIFRRTVAALLAAGYELRIWEGEDWACERTADAVLLENNMMSTDEDRLKVYEQGATVAIGWVRFIFGNTGWDVMADYTTNLEPVLKPVNDYAEAIAEHF